MKKTLIAIASVVMTVSASYAQILVAGWDFQTTTTGGTPVAAAPATPKIFTANFGAGTLYFDGSNGSSNWFVPASGSTNTELNAFSGSTVNTSASDGTLLSIVTSGSSALAVVGGAGTAPASAANGKSAVFVFSMVDKINLSISLSAQRTSTGFTNQLWEYSANGGTSWASIGSFASGTTAGTLASSFATSGVLSLPTFSGLDGIADARVRVTFTGASASAGNNRLDNIQLNAVPEPSSGALLVLGGVSLVAIRSLRKKSS